MTEEIKNIYFETSAVNYLLDNVFDNSEFSSIETKILQLQKGRRWYISNITLWEIFLTKDEDRRYKLFDFSRCLFYDYLIPSPEEIIIKYIQNGIPLIENRYELISDSLFSKEWTVACKNLDYAFQPDREQIEDLTTHFRFLGEYFIKTENGYVLHSFDNSEDITGKISVAFLKYIFNSLLKIYGTKPTKEEVNFLSISLKITMIILCYGIGFDQPTIEHFWNKYKIAKPLERLEYTVKHFPNIFFRGPIANITKMVILQSQNKSGRGLYFDSLHSIYITYADLYISSDEHFLKYKNKNNNDPNMEKVVDAKDITFFNPNQ